MNKLADIETEALNLPDEQRFSLVNSLLSKGEEGRVGEVEALWNSEITRRISLLDSGNTERLPASAVFEELERRRL